MKIHNKGKVNVNNVDIFEVLHFSVLNIEKKVEAEFNFQQTKIILLK